MKTVVWRVAVVVMCTLALSATVLGAAMADTGTSPDDNGQLLDVSNAVSGIQKKLNDLLAHGRWARTGTLLAGADCGYGAPAPYFAAWGDASSYALAPQGDFASTDAWTLNKQATVVAGGDPFTGAAY